MFKVSARTVLELGSELISSDIIALYELIKNGFDAGTKNGVEIRFNVVLRRNALLTLQNLIERDEVPLDELKQAALKSFNVKAMKSLFDHASEILDNARSTSSFGKALTEIY